MTLEAIVNSPTVARLGLALMHSLWQGAIIAIVLAMALRLSRKRSAQFRYAISLGALVLMIAIPVATFSSMRPDQLNVAEVRRAVNNFAVAVENSKTTNSALTNTDEIRVSYLGNAAISEQPQTASWTGAFVEFSRQWNAWLPWLTLAWMLGVLTLSIWHLAAWGVVQRLRRRWVREVEPYWIDTLRRLAARMGIERPVLLVESAAVEVPSLVGWLKPVILLPATALIGLTPSQIETILAHELAHVRRHDYLVNLLQTFAETLLFYHPGVWWISRRIRHERENCCDDLVIEMLGDRRGYALALTKMEELRTASSAYAMALTGGDLMNRIRRVLGMQEAESTGGRWVAGALLSLSLLIAAACVWTRGPQAVAQTTEDSAGTLSVTNAPRAPVPGAAPRPVAMAVEPEPVPGIPGAPAAPAAGVAPAVPAPAANWTSPEKMAGFVDFEASSLVGDKRPSVQIDLNPVALQIAKGALSQNDPGMNQQVDELMNGIDFGMLRVRIYEGLDLDEPGKKGLASGVQEASDKLLNKGWTPVVRITDGGEQVNILMKTEANRVKGITAFICDGGDLVFGNLVLDAEASQLGSKVGMGMSKFMNGDLDVDKLMRAAQGHADKDSRPGAGARRDVEAKKREARARAEATKAMAEQTREANRALGQTMKEHEERMTEMRTRLNEMQSRRNQASLSSEQLKEIDAATQEIKEAMEEQRASMEETRAEMKKTAAEMEKTRAEQGKSYAESSQHAMDSSKVPPAQ